MRKWLLVLISFVMVASMILVSCADGTTPPPPPPPPEKDPYVLGLAGSMTGPMAVTYLPLIDGIRIYLEAVNDRGGINGRQVKMLIEDSKSSPSEAATAARKLTELGVQLLAAPDGSPTYAAYVVEAKRANVPVIIGGIAAPQAYPPTPDPLIYNSMWGAYKSTAVVGYQLAQYGGEGAKGAFLTLDSPAVKIAGEFIVEKGKEFGLSEVLFKTVPIGTLDLTPVAIAFKEFGAVIATAYGPSAYNTLLADALIKIGYEGDLWLLVPEPPEPYFEKYAGVENIILALPTVPLEDNWPIHKEIEAAANKYGVSELNSALNWGWEEGIVLEAIFKDVGWPVTTEKLVEVMEDLEVKRPFMGTFHWTPEDHAAPILIRDYTWDEAKGDWVYKPPMVQGDSYGNVKQLTEIS